jgi:uncharacterized protein involved in exopolysaccharide biosynthesis
VVTGVGADRLRDGEPVEPGTTAAAQVAEMVALLRENLVVEPLKKTTLIRVVYRSPDPELSATVLQQLATLYLAKHLEVHRPKGAHTFFAQQTDRFEGELEAARGRLTEFVQDENVVSATVEQTAALERLGALQAAHAAVTADIADAGRRLATLEAEAKSTPARQVTQISNVGNVETLRNLNQQILTLDITRNEMLQKFTPTYPPVMRIDEQLTQLRAALAEVERTPLRDETTDQNPTSNWLQTELARVRSERAGLVGKSAEIQRSIAEHTALARRLEGQSLRQDELKRQVKSAEDTFDLYARKQEEARVSDALDTTRIANVAVAEPASTPQAPIARRRPLIALLALFAAVIAGIGGGYVMHLMTPRFHTPDDVVGILGVPVLGSVPREANR